MAEQLTHKVFRQPIVFKICYFTSLCKPEVLEVYIFHQHAINFCSLILLFFLSVAVVLFL